MRNKINKAFRLMIVRVYCYNTLTLGGLTIVIPLAFLFKYLKVDPFVGRIIVDCIAVLILVFRYKIYNYFIKFEP